MRPVSCSAICLLAPWSLAILSPTWFDECSKPGSPQLSDVFLSYTTREPIAVLAVPVKRDGKVIWSLQLAMRNQEFGQLLNEHLLPPGWLSGIVDRQGRFLARVPDNDRRIGHLASDGWRAAIQDRPDESWDRFASLEGDSVSTATRAHPRRATSSVSVCRRASSRRRCIARFGVF